MGLEHVTGLSGAWTGASSDLTAWRDSRAAVGSCHLQATRCESCQLRDGWQAQTAPAPESVTPGLSLSKHTAWRAVSMGC